MATQTDPPSTRDGVRRHATAPRRRIAWLVTLAVGLPVVATLVAVLVIRLGAEERGRASMPEMRVATAPRPGSVALRPAAAAPVAVASPAHVMGTPSAVAVRRRAVREAGTADEKATRPPAGRGPRAAPTPDDTRPQIDAADAIAALRADGETGGIAAFNPPGTKPLKPGVIVPEGYELPEGFVRHYQTTDDGQQLPPILMVHPDYELVDANGKPVTTPDGVVPAELVPPGMPIQMLEVPERRNRTNLPD
jgi:hypothetical protein